VNEKIEQGRQVDGISRKHPMEKEEGGVKAACGSKQEKGEQQEREAMRKGPQEGLKSQSYSTHRRQLQSLASRSEM